MQAMSTTVITLRSPPGAAAAIAPCTSRPVFRSILRQQCR